MQAGGEGWKAGADRSSADRSSAGLFKDRRETSVFKDQRETSAESPGVLLPRETRLQSAGGGTFGLRLRREASAWPAGLLFRNHSRARPRLPGPGCRSPGLGCCPLQCPLHLQHLQFRLCGAYKHTEV